MQMFNRPVEAACLAELATDGAFRCPGERRPVLQRERHWHWHDGVTKLT
jgi:hypothetical protein